MSKIADQTDHVFFSLCLSIYQIRPSFYLNTPTLEPLKYLKLWGCVLCVYLCLRVSKIGLEDTDEQLHVRRPACKDSKTDDPCEMCFVLYSWLRSMYRLLCCLNIQKREDTNNGREIPCSRGSWVYIRSGQWLVCSNIDNLLKLLCVQKCWKQLDVFF